MKHNLQRLGQIARRRTGPPRAVPCRARRAPQAVLDSPVRMRDAARDASGRSFGGGSFLFGVIPVRSGVGPVRFIRIDIMQHAGQNGHAQRNKAHIPDRVSDRGNAHGQEEKQQRCGEQKSLGADFPSPPEKPSGDIRKAEEQERHYDKKNDKIIQADIHRSLLKTWDAKGAQAAHFLLMLFSPLWQWRRTVSPCACPHADGPYLPAGGTSIAPRPGMRTGRNVLDGKGICKDANRNHDYLLVAIFKYGIEVFCRKRRVVA